jgi:hypothetical protein
MKKSFAIIFDPIIQESDEKKFVEAIRSKYVSKKAKNNMYIIISDHDESSKLIYDDLFSRMNFPISFLVIQLDSFYGLFQEEAVSWLRDQFPKHNWVD